MTGVGTEILVLAASTIRLATPLFLAAIAGIFAERAGVADLGLEGKILVGAFAGAAIAAVTGSAALGVFAAMAAATVFSMLHGYATVWRPGDQIISGIAINIIAAGLVPTLAYALFPLGGSTPRLSGSARLGGLDLPFAHSAARMGGIGRLYELIVSGHSPLIDAAMLLAPLSMLMLYRTGWGLRLRAAGENPEAVASAGRSVIALRFQALAVNGALSGLAGAYLSLAANAGYSRDMSAGKGYLAIAALILGRWKPWPTLGACALFAATDALQGRLQGVEFPLLGIIPAPWITALPYIVTVIVLAVTGRGLAIPKALGIPFMRAR